jgi:membrane-associated phospholipid phosphatase
MFLKGSSQNDSISEDKIVYKLKPAIDIPIITIGTLWSVFAFTKIYNKSHPTIDQINRLNKDDINAFDRWAIFPYSKSLDKISYYPFYASIPLPLILFMTRKEMRSDFLQLTLLYWEAMSITGLIGTNATYNVDRYRPYAYSSETPMEKRTGRIAKNSFYAGHVQVVATPTFFMAKVYADYYPDSKIKWVFYGIASLATGTTAYMRLRGGEHFPTDILLGTAAGALAGILVPHYHKIHSEKKSAMSVLPYVSGEINGLVFTYKFKKN